MNVDPRILRKGGSISIKRLYTKIEKYKTSAESIWIMKTVWEILGNKILKLIFLKLIFPLTASPLETKCLETIIKLLET